jgi:hypothetical protein
VALYLSALLQITEKKSGYKNMAGAKPMKINGFHLLLSDNR